MAYIKLTLAGFSVTFSKFFGDSIPRISPNENSIEYSASGNPVISGFAYEVPQLWNLDAYCSAEDYQKLLAIHAESDRLRRAGSDFRITLEDTTLPIVEKSPRTRAIVSGESETAIVGSVNYTSYSAKFYCWIVKRPDFRQLGKGWGVSFTAQEAGKFAA